MKKVNQFLLAALLVGIASIWGACNGGPTDDQIRSLVREEVESQLEARLVKAVADVKQGPPGRQGPAGMRGARGPAGVGSEGMSDAIIRLEKNLGVVGPVSIANQSDLVKFRVELSNLSTTNKECRSLIQEALESHTHSVEVTGTHSHFLYPSYTNSQATSGAGQTDTTLISVRSC